MTVLFIRDIIVDEENNKSEYYTGGETKMISESYIKNLLLSMGYIKKNHIYEKFFSFVDCYIKVI